MPPMEREAAARRRVAHLADVTSSSSGVPSGTSQGVGRGAVVVVGGMVLDVQAAPPPGSSLLRGTTTPGFVRQTPGGVGRNIAEGVARASQKGTTPPLLISAVGDDLAGAALMEAWRGLFLDRFAMDASVATRGVRVCPGASTPTVAAVLDNSGEVAAAVADCDTVERFLDSKWINKHSTQIANAAAVVFDGNVSPSALAAVANATRVKRMGNYTKENKSPLLWFEPVSVAKAVRATEARILHLIDVVSPNVEELRAMANAARNGDENSHAPAADPSPTATALEIVKAVRHDIHTLLTAGVGNVVLTLGERGVALCWKTNRDERSNGSGHQKRESFTCVYVSAFPANVKSLVGAGDALVAGCVAALSNGYRIDKAVVIGAAAAQRAVETDLNVAIGPGVLFSALEKLAQSAQVVRDTVWV